MELLKEQFMASQIYNSHDLKGTICIAGESHDPYGDNDNMSIASLDKSADASMDDFFDALIHIQSAKGKRKAKDV